jgi:hypothetical protein
VGVRLKEGRGGVEGGGDRHSFASFSKNRKHLVFSTPCAGRQRWQEVARKGGGEEENGGLLTACMRPECGRAMAVDAGREHWQRRAKRAVASPAAPFPASAERAILPLRG